MPGWYCLCALVHVGMLATTCSLSKLGCVRFFSNPPFFEGERVCIYNGQPSGFSLDHFFVSCEPTALFC